PILMTARSESGSSPTSSAAATRPSGSVTSRALARPATWLLLTMYPSGVMMNPEPEPACALRPRAPRSTRMWATAGATWATTPVTALEYASSISASAGRGSWRAGTAARASSATAKGNAAMPWREEAIDWKMVARAAAFKHSANWCPSSRSALTARLEQPFQLETRRAGLSTTHGFDSKNQPTQQRTIVGPRISAGRHDRRLTVAQQGLRLDLLLIFLLPYAGRHRALRVRVLRRHVLIPTVLAAVEIGERLAGERVHAAVVSQRDAGYAERKRGGCYDLPGQ